MEFQLKTTNLTIQEAIKSGKPFKRANATVYLGTYDSHECIFSPADVLATDWEIKREPMVVYVNVYDDGSTGAWYGTAFEAAKANGQLKFETRKFVEVIE